MKFGTHEWATHTVNILNGCMHDCKYCYSKEMAIRFKRNTADGWKEEKINSLKLNIPSKTGTVMFPSSHDLSPNFLEEELAVIGKLLKLKKNVLLVSKPHLKVIEAVCKEFFEYKEDILFRFSIGSIHDEALRFWEPNAPSAVERIEALKFAYRNGFRTSVSMEPILDTDSKNIVNHTIGYVNEKIWIGKPNFLLRRLKVNGFGEDTIEYKKATKLIKDQSDEYILELYKLYKSNKKIEWKESIKKVLIAQKVNIETT